MNEELIRAVSLLKKIFYIYREAYYAEPRERLEWDSENCLLIFPAAEGRRRREGSPLIALPHIYHNEWEKEAMLSFLQCLVPVTHLKSLVEWMLKDICKNVVGVVLDGIKAPPFRINEVHPLGRIDNTEFRHSLFKIALHNDELYALDLTGAQYGWFEPLCPWTEVVENRCDEHRISNMDGATYIRHSRHGTTTRTYSTRDPMDNVQDPAQSASAPQMNWYQAVTGRAFAHAMQPYFDSQPAIDLLGLPQVYFKNLEREFLEYVRLEAEMATLVADEAWRAALEVNHETEIARHLDRLEEQGPVDNSLEGIAELPG